MFMDCSFELYTCMVKDFQFKYLMHKIQYLSTHLRKSDPPRLLLLLTYLIYLSI